MKYLIFLIGNYDSPTFDNQQLLSLELAHNYDVICIEYPGFKNLFRLIRNKFSITSKINPKLTVFHSFGLIPYGRSFKLINRLNYTLSYLLLRHIIFPRLKSFKVITFTPEIYSIPNKSIIKAYYYVIDDYLSYPCWSETKQKRQFKHLESKFLPYSHKVITSSSLIYQKYKKMHHNVTYFSNPGYLVDIRRTPLKHDLRFARQLSDIQKPIIGFIGGIESYRMDFNLIKKISNHFPDHLIVLAGPIGKNDYSTKNELVFARNINYLGYIQHNKLSQIIHLFDVCIIPYKLNQYGQMCFPIKIFEYLALGKPVVTTALPSIKHLAKHNVIYWANNNKEFISLIIKALREKKNKRLIEIRKKLAYENSWRNKKHEFLRIISG